MKESKIKILILVLVLFVSACAKEERKPVAITITSVTVTEFPGAKPDGSGWDVSTGADIYLSISKGNTIYPNDKVSNVRVNTGTADVFTLSANNYTINDLNSQWAIGIHDQDDLDPDDPMAGVTIVPANYQDDLPSTINFDTGGFAGSISLTWNY